MDLLAIKNRTTAAYYPFSNGIVQRNNAVLKETMSKVHADLELRELDNQAVLEYASMAKNTLLNRKYYSTFQTVFDSSAWKDCIENELTCAYPKD